MGDTASAAVPFSVFMHRALYDPDTGFYATGGAAGRRGDFVTSPEVGPLFGAVMARALDAWWIELGRPDPFWVIDAGAGPGTLARTIDAAAPACAAVWRYVAVEVSDQQRRQHPPWVDSQAALPTTPVVGVVLANELLDNLPVDLHHAGQPVQVREGPSGFVLEPDVNIETCQPDCTGARAWLREALSLVHRGRVVVIDYTDRVSRDPWLRTFRGHQPGGHPLDQPGTQDITVDVPVAQLEAVAPLSSERSQADWLRDWGIDELVEEGRRIWHERAPLGDLAAVRARSRVTEAAALLDPAGLGSFTVLEWIVNAV